MSFTMISTLLSGVAVDVVVVAVVKPLNAVMDRFKSDTPVEETTRECPECVSKIPKKAMGGSASAPREDFGRPMSPAFADARRAAMENRDMKRGRRFAEGGIFNDEYMAYQSKGPKTRGTARKGREQGRRERRAREAMEHAEMYAPGKSLDMADRKNRGGMPVHRRKPMYGGGKC